MSKKVAVVVGAGGNLGTAVCSFLSEIGYEIDSTFVGANRPDVRSPDAFSKLPSRIDAAIYLAGINVTEPCSQLSDEKWDQVLDVNLKGAFRFAKAAYQGLKSTGGTFVTISSIMATHPYPNRIAYASAKAGLEGLTRTLAVEWGNDGISTHCIRLGHLEGLMKTTPSNPLLLEKAREHSPLKRLIAPNEVARYIGWLVDGGSKAVSGSVIDFDPAYTINRWPL